MTNNLKKVKSNIPTAVPLIYKVGQLNLLKDCFHTYCTHGIRLYLYIYIFLCLFVCLQRNPTCSASHLQGCRWDSSIHSRTVFQLNLLFAPEILAVLSRMEASLIQVFLFPQRILRGMDGRRIFF